MNRNANYKMSGLRMTNTTKARALRMDEQHGNRRMARQAKNDAKRGLAEIDQNLLNAENAPAVVAEVTHEQKLQDRLARLKVWREQRAKTEEKAKAKKKVPFLVPGIARANKQVLTGTEGRVTRSQAKKPVDVEKQWTITVSKPVKVKKPAIKNSKKENQSFAPTGFVFTAPKEIATKAIELQKEASAGTPQRQPQSVNFETENGDMKISPLVFNHPWISTTRGSSSKKQRLSVEANLNLEPQSSPLLKRRSIRERKSVVELSNPDALHFRALMASEGTRLTDLCNNWEELLSNGEVPEEETGSVRTVIGQAHLLQRERFTQFAGLVKQFEEKSGEKEITPTDLEGFWEMIYLQVSDVDRKFNDLTKLKENGWVNIMPEPQKKSKVGIKKKAPVVQARAAKSNMRALIAAARKKQLTENGMGSPVNKRNSLLLSPGKSSPLRTPGKRQSLRRSVLLSSAKKPVFIVTDIVTNEQEEKIDTSNAACHSAYSEPDNNVRTPRRVSRRLDTKSSASPTVHLSHGDNEEVAMNVTPSPKKSYGRARVIEASSPEERLSEAFDALKTDSEPTDRLTPLKVFRSPLDSKRSNVQIRSLRAQAKEEIEDNGVTFSPRRSLRHREPVTEAKGRASLLPTTVISPVIPHENLMSFD